MSKRYAAGMSLPRGNVLLTLLAGALCALHGAVLFVVGLEAEGARVLLRATARTSVFIFQLAFGASAFVRFAPSALTRGIARRRRELGLAAFVSHTIHLGAIAWYTTFSDFATDATTVIVGGIAYVFFFLMAATSTRASKKKLGPWWKRLHVTGGWWIWSVFLATNAGNIGANRLYVIPVAALLGVALLRWAPLRRAATAALLLTLTSLALPAKTSGQASAIERFSWINEGCSGEALGARALAFLGLDEEPRGESPSGLRHATFRSALLGQDVGYCIYLPPGYDTAAFAERSFPVVYHLHGGRPGNESRSAQLSSFVDAAIRAGRIGPAIYVFPNGGLVSHYDSDQHHSPGKSVFLQELLPHVESTYRTLPGPGGRALQGFSQGGRGAARVIFEHPELFCSAAPGGAGFATELAIAENGGVERTPTGQRNFGGALELGDGNDAYSLARAAVGQGTALPPLLFWFGTRDFNYESNLAYLGFLEEIGIAFERLVVADAPHHPSVVYETHGLELMTFHQRSCDWPQGSRPLHRFEAGSTVARTSAQHDSLSELGERIWWRATGRDMEWNNKNLHQIVPTVNVPRRGQVRELARSLDPRVAAFRVDTPEGPTSFDQLVQSGRTGTMGVVVLARGEIVYESYPQMEPHEKPIWWSVTKVLAGTLVELLIERGQVDPADSIDRYLPRLAGSDFAGVSVRDVLDMASGVDCPDGDYSDTSTCYMQFEAAFGDAERTASSPNDPYDYVASLDVGRWAEPGTGFDYSGVNTFVLAWLAEELLGMPFQDAVSAELWSRLGAEHDASIYAARRGVALASGGLLAAPRDVARLGLLFTPSASVVTERSPISQRHIEHLLHGGRPELLERARFGRGARPAGVRHNVSQWDRVFDNDDLYKGGWAGQGLLINPRRDLVAVWVGYSFDDGSELSLLPYVRAVLEGLFGGEAEASPQTPRRRASFSIFPSGEAGRPSRRRPPRTFAAQRTVRKVCPG
ncbi:MAG: serine hydrolase, partial [Acidobacteriota bacterium]